MGMVCQAALRGGKLPERLPGCFKRILLRRRRKLCSHDDAFSLDIFPHPRLVGLDHKCDTLAPFPSHRLPCGTTGYTALTDVPCYVSTPSANPRANKAVRWGPLRETAAA